MFNVIYQWLIVWVNVLAYKLDSLTETIWGYCDEGCKHAQISVGSLWITLSGWHESQWQRLTTKDARSQLSMQKAMQGDKGSWEVAIGGVGCRAVDGWTRKGSKQVSKTTYSDKNCWPTHRHWQWGTEGGSALVPKIVPSTGQANRVLYEAREQKMQERDFFPHTVL